mmetsp:Transcript_45169/g.82565  ORF Transcript_45169/g.82565 Transcript_45169/m.82565 type:complete len:215 (+) Transcript_45169:92-736(+)
MGNCAPSASPCCTKLNASASTMPHHPSTAEQMSFDGTQAVYSDQCTWPAAPGSCRKCASGACCYNTEKEQLLEVFHRSVIAEELQDVHKQTSLQSQMREGLEPLPGPADGMDPVSAQSTDFVAVLERAGGDLGLAVRFKDASSLVVSETKRDSRVAEWNVRNPDCQIRSGLVLKVVNDAKAPRLMLKEILGAEKLKIHFLGPEEASETKTGSPV